MRIIELIYYNRMFSIIISTNLSRILLSFSINSLQSFNNFLMPVVVLFILYIFVDEVNEDNLYRAYTIVGLIVIAGMFYQSVGYYLFDRPAAPIAFLPVSEANQHFWGNFEGS